MSRVKTTTTDNVKPTKSIKSKSNSESKIIRLDMRIDQDKKLLIETAATLTGQTVTNFAISNLVEKAIAVIEQHQKIALSNRDRDIFLSALEREPKHLPELAKALELHSKIVVTSTGE